jgi:hypothetical protein
MKRKNQGNPEIKKITVQTTAGKCLNLDFGD